MKFAFTADDKIVVLGIKVFRILKVPLPLKGMARTPYLAACSPMSARIKALACVPAGVEACAAFLAL